MKIALPMSPSGSSAASSVIPTVDLPMLTNVLRGSVVDIQSLLGSNTPISAKQFLNLLSSSNQVEVAKLLPGIDEKTIGSGLTEDQKNKVAEILERYPNFKTYLDNNKTALKAATSFPSLAPSVNNNVGLHLLLANPMIARVVMEQRKKQALTARAVPVAVPMNPFGMPVGVSVSFTGGAMNELENLDNNIPIEMRGAGYTMAHMRGGSILFGTVGSPTMWRPLDDNSFISASLQAAIDNLESQLKSKGATLDSSTRTQIDAEIASLKKAEDQVKKTRDQITNMNNAISTGSAQVKTGDNIGPADIERTAEAYNNAMKSRQKIEGKLLRVVVALGSKVAGI